MATAIPAKEVTTKQVRAVRFGFYTDEEVRKLSVVKITNPIIFDNMRVPVPDGLYDPRLGPMDFRDRCGTCHQNYDRCPGHFGHIDLAVPVYNPLVFKVLYKLMRCICVHCHHFKLAQETVDAYHRKLQSLVAGDLVQAEGVRVDPGKKAKELQDLLADKDQCKTGKAAPERGAGGCTITQHTLEAMKDTISDLMSKMNGARCQNCKAHNPAVKKQGATKLFCVWTSRKALLDNAKEGVNIKNVLGTGDDVLGELERGMAQQLTAASEGRKRARAAREEADGTVPVDAKGVVKTGAYGADDSDGDLYEGDEDDKDVDHKRSKTEVPDGAVDVHQGEDVVETAGPSGRGTATGGKASRGPLPPDLDVSTKYMTPTEVETHMKLLWQKEWPILSLIYSAQIESNPDRAGTRLLSEKEARDAYKMFFLHVLIVTPNKFRPPSKVNDEMYEHSQNVFLAKILRGCLELTATAPATDAAATTKGGVGADPEQAAALDLSNRMRVWLELQNNVCGLMDSTTAEGGDNDRAQGIRQQLEKKEGLFRKNMMGKRVNFAARSVISPDPFIGVGEIGVPPYFAKRLSFPERVTPFNVDRLRAAVVVGADQHPGAVAVEEVSSGRMISLANMPLLRRQALAKQLMSNTAMLGRTTPLSTRHHQPRLMPGSSAAPASAGPTSNYIVYRHLMDGDLMLTNRQPTLHKPGLMAHRARVLKGERTIRFHYANCATFNADFDGDEINLHLPQDQLGRAEGYVVVHADQQYIVPTDGKPIRGLIQDHVVSATLLTKRGTWLNAEEYRQLVYVACTPWTGKSPVAASAAAAAAASGAAKAKVTVSAVGSVHDIALEPPCMIKPRRLWSGKQVVSTVISHFTAGLPPLSCTAGSKVPASYWGANSGEDECEFYRGALVRGCVDKNTFGKYGLVHSLQELYGNAVAGRVLSAFSRLFTYYLQWNGFTCGMDDLFLIPSAETRRDALLATAEARAVQASMELLNTAAGAKQQSLPPAVLDNPRSHARELLLAELRTAAALGERYRANRNTGQAHDMKGSGAMHGLSSEVIKICLPGGQVKAFPKNTLSLMTITGAKGSLVNFSQISCLLGQQELEGRRPPRMASGKTLPCFRPYDGGGRSNGFIGDRFLTGLRPQEYYFHCMAGREGLVDTAVKTSRSGYLQRCLVKNLESLRVHYDGTVRDNCDGSVVQLAYGEDGLDVTLVSHMKQFDFMARNAERFAQVVDATPAFAASRVAGLVDREAQVARDVAKRAELLAQAAAHDSAGRKADAAAARKAAAAMNGGLPLSALHPSSVAGVTSEAFTDALRAYVRANPHGELRQPLSEPAPEAGTSAPDGGKKSKKEKRAAEKAAAKAAAAGVLVTGRRRGQNPGAVDGETFASLMALKFMRCLAAAGEGVGVLAAQSIGEPSTQMTLNTFHMAGRGEANVTLGIPRLREILMTAAKKIKTPVMTVPLRADAPPGAGAVLANRMRRLRLAECLSGITCEERPVAQVAGLAEGFGRTYRVTLHFFNPAQYPPEAELTFQELVHVFKGMFSKRLQHEVENAAKRKSGMRIGKVDVSTVRDEEASAGAGDEDGEAPKVVKAKGKSEKTDVFEDGMDDGEETREGKLRFRGGRGEAATYDAGDEEDEVAAADARREAGRRDLGGAEDEEGDSEEEQAEPADDDEAGPAIAPTQQQPRPAVAAAGGTDPDIDYVCHTCSLTITLPLTSPKLLMLEIVEKVAAITLVRTTPGIDKVYVVEGQGKEGPRIQTDGVNFEGAWAHSDLADVNAVTTNDVTAMLKQFGVEAARATIMREASSVFNAYGIGVDPRHLSLIADFMTHQGGYRACNRIGIESSVSPFLKMSFETAAHFLTDATLRGAVDDLKSPAARICVGRVVEVGTGCVELVQQLC